MEQTIEQQLEKERARLYRCRQCGAVLGVIQRERRPHLNVFRVPVLRAALTIEYVRELKNFVMLNLEHGTVICGRCGARKPWLMSEQAIEELLESRARRTFGLSERTSEG